ncbi:MAG TPA: hypothetical protein VJ998_12225, partial [Pseudomonadales bacterium]|nr:hypothetical protein [Pseudomonadales bacterium]
MSRTLLIAQREFLENMRTRGFWIGILMLPLVLALVALVPLAVQSLSKPKHYTVVDHSGWLLPVIRQEINADDLADLLTEVKAGQQDVPKTFAGIKPVLNALNSTQVHALSFRILATLQFSAKHDDVVLPEPVLTYIDQNGVRLAHWWQQLPAQQKSSYASRISTNKYLYEPPQGRDIQALNLAVKKGELAGYFVIGKHPIDGSDGSRFVSNNLTDQSLASWFSGYVNRHIRSERLRQKEITPTVAAWVNEPISFEGVQIADNGQEKTVN